MNSLDEAPLSATEFGRLLDAVGPFDAPPRVAVATSGGADSVALCLLTHQWAENRNGKCHALIVDHGLRSNSVREAAQVADWLNRSGVDAHVLTWSGRKPVRGIQAAAREARYELLLSWCRDNRIRDLLLAHHRDDQAETFLLRLGRNSGVDGLSAMAAVSHRGDVRLVRPLLELPKSRLVATLKNFGTTVGRRSLQSRPGICPVSNSRTRANVVGCRNYGGGDCRDRPPIGPRARGS